MSSDDTYNVTLIAKAIVESGLNINGTIIGRDDDYEIVSYVDEVVILNSLEQEIVSLPRDTEFDND
jgi:hypothetical protein